MVSVRYVKNKKTIQTLHIRQEEDQERIQRELDWFYRNRKHRDVAYIEFSKPVLAYLLFGRNYQIQFKIVHKEWRDKEVIDKIYIYYIFLAPYRAGDSNKMYMNLLSVILMILMKM